MKIFLAICTFCALHAFLVTLESEVEPGPPLVDQVTTAR